jgi:hypothetical protein
MVINSTVGYNTLGSFVKKLSMKAGLSTLYTNHYNHAMCITSLDQSGIEARHIMFVGRHKYETSIKNDCDFKVKPNSKKHLMF